MPTITPALAARRKAVFAACRQLGLDDDARRAMLKSVAGVDSTTKLDMGKARAVLDHLRRAGAARPKAERPAQPVGRHPGYPEHVRRECDALIGKVEALLADMGLSWEYARQILRRVSGGWKNPEQLGKEAFRFAEADDLTKVVAALTYEQDKRQLLARVEEKLVLAQLTKADVHNIVPGLPANWERRPASLRALLAALAGA